MISPLCDSVSESGADKMNPWLFRGWGTLKLLIVLTVDSGLGNAILPNKGVFLGLR